MLWMDIRKTSKGARAQRNCWALGEIIPEHSVLSFKQRSCHRGGSPCQEPRSIPPRLTFSTHGR